MFPFCIVHTETYAVLQMGQNNSVSSSAGLWAACLIWDLNWVSVLNVIEHSTHWNFPDAEDVELVPGRSLQLSTSKMSGKSSSAWNTLSSRAVGAVGKVRSFLTSSSGLLLTAFPTELLGGVPLTNNGGGLNLTLSCASSFFWFGALFSVVDWDASGGVVVSGVDLDVSDVDCHDWDWLKICEN